MRKIKSWLVDWLTGFSSIWLKDQNIKNIRGRVLNFISLQNTNRNLKDRVDVHFLIFINWINTFRLFRSVNINIYFPILASTLLPYQCSSPPFPSISHPPQNFKNFPLSQTWSNPLGGKDGGKFATFRLNSDQASSN